MGVSGTDVAKEAADMVLLDDNFATIVSAVRLGRGIFANIQKFLRFLLSSNMGEVLTVFFGVLLASQLGLDAAGVTIATPLLATQILWINLLTDSGPALALGVDPPPEDVMRRPPRRLTDHVIDREMWVTILATGAVMAAVSLLALDLRLPGGWVGDTGGIDEARTMAFTTLVLAQLFNAFNARSARASAFHRLFANRWLWVAVAVSAVLQVAVVELEFMNDAFKTTPLSLEEWLICTGLASIVLWASELRKLIASVWRSGALSGRRERRTAPRPRAAR
jgi:magnesium-transporting ATPase (P-type)